MDMTVAIDYGGGNQKKKNFAAAIVFVKNF